MADGDSTVTALEWPSEPFEKGAEMDELGVSGLRQNRGVIMEEPLRQLQGQRGRKVFREMSLMDDVVSGALAAIKMLVRQVDWWEEPASNDNPDDIANAEFLGEVREDMSHTWEDFISDTLGMVIYGWSYHEIVYKRRSGSNPQPGLASRFDDDRIGIRKLHVRGQDTLERWDIDEDGGIKGMVQQVDGKRYYIPIEKALLFRVDSHKNNPEGQSMLRGAYRSWYFKKRHQEIEAIALERDGTGIAVAWVPPKILASGATPADRAIRTEVEKIVVNLRVDEQAGILMPLAYDANGKKVYDLELMASPGTRSIESDKVINRYDRGIAGSMLADFILLGHEQHGSHALSSDKTTLFATALGSILDSAQAVLNRHLVPRLFRLNGIDADDLPRWQHGDIESVALSELAGFVEAMARAGAPIFPDDELEDHLREMANLPKRATVSGDLDTAMMMDEGRLPPAPTDAQVETNEEEGLG